MSRQLQAPSVASPDERMAVPAVAQIPTADSWDLHARPDLVGAAAQRWLAVAAAVSDAADDVNTPATALGSGGWDGAAADSFAAHRRSLIGDLDTMAELAKTVAMLVRRVAAALSTAQSHLTGEWARVAVVPFGYESPRQLRFSPRTAAEEHVVLDSIGVCERIRGDLDQQLGADIASFERARAEFGRIAATWLAVAEGRNDPFTAPLEVATTGVIYDGNEVIVSTGTGDDDVEIGIDSATGMQVVTVNGTRYYFPAGADVVVRGGAGQDSITVAPGTALHLTLSGGTGADTIHGGDGNDTILGLGGHDLLYGGAGDDCVSAGADHDYVEGGTGNDDLSGGLGDDTLYGLDGNDSISGDEGRDYLEGATGDDSLDGGSGNDVLSGGRGDDTKHGGAGDDVFYAGRGNDVSDGGQGNDTSYGESSDAPVGVEHNVTVQIKDLGTSINVEGSPEFMARVEADLEMLRCSPRGQLMLAALDHGHDNGDTLTIREYDNPKVPDNSSAGRVGRDNVINYNPHLDKVAVNGGSAAVAGPPVAFLYHEMAHIYDYENDSLAPGTYAGTDDRGQLNREREAAGLPIDADNPDTPPQIYGRHPYDLTENGLRDEMGAQHRDAY